MIAIICAFCLVISSITSQRVVALSINDGRQNSKQHLLTLTNDIELLDAEIDLTENLLSSYQKKLDILTRLSAQKSLKADKKFVDAYLDSDKMFSMVSRQFRNRLSDFEADKELSGMKAVSSKNFSNKVSKKAMFPIPNETKELFFLNTFPYRSSQGAMMNYMIIAQLTNHTICFYDLAGQRMVDPYSPGHAIHMLSIAPRVDEVIIATLGSDNVVKMVRLDNKRIRYNSTTTAAISSNSTLVNSTIDGNNSSNNTIARLDYLNTAAAAAAFDEEEEFEFKKYIGQSETPFVQQERVRKDSGQAQLQQQQSINSGNRRSRNGTRNATGVGLNSTVSGENPRRELTRPQSNGHAAMHSPNSNPKAKPKKQEKFKYAVKREGKFKLTELLEGAGIEKSSDIQITSFLYQTSKGTKLFLIGDANGFIHTYHKNGTFKGSVKAAESPIIHLVKSFPNTIFATNTSLGQINPLNQDVIFPICDKFVDGIKSIQTDSISNTQQYVLTWKNDIVVIDIKAASESPCKYRSKLKTSWNAQTDVSILPVRNSLLAWNGETSIAEIFNTTDFTQTEDMMLQLPFQIEIHKQWSDKSPKMGFKHQKVNSATTMLLVEEKSGDMSRAAIYEVTIPQKQESDFINNIRGPILIVAALIFIGYQYFKKDQDEQKQSFEDFNNKIAAATKKGESQEAKVPSAKPEESTQKAIESSKEYDQVQKPNLEPKHVQFTEREKRVIRQSGRMHDIDEFDTRSHFYN